MKRKAQKTRLSTLARQMLVKLIFDNNIVLKQLIYHVSK